MITRTEYFTAPFEQQAEMHRKYYGQFVTPAIKTSVVRYWGVEQLIKAFAKDENFNTLPLRGWDLLRLPESTHEQVKAAGDWVCLSVRICINKEAARQIVEERTARKTD